MKNILSLFTKVLALFVLLATFSAKAWSADENNTIYIHLINTTPDTLTFERVISSKPGNEFTMDVQRLGPGETTTLTAVKNMNHDIEAKLLFNNGKDDIAILQIHVQRQFHMGQMELGFNGEKFTSSLTSKTPNPNIGPLFLTYIAADLSIAIRPAVID